MPPAGRGKKPGNQVERSPHRQAAYDAGRELALRDGTFNEPFFQQQQRRKTVRRSVHIISDTERIVTEETIYEDTRTSTNDNFWNE